MIVDGLPVGPVSSYAFNSLAGNHTINATFAINQYSITANPGLNGAMDLRGRQTLLWRNTKLQYHTKYWVSRYGCVCGWIVCGHCRQLPVLAFGANHTISATFDVDAFTITASSDVNGSISPVGPTSVGAHANQAYTITPNWLLSHP